MMVLTIENSLNCHEKPKLTDDAKHPTVSSCLLILWLDLQLDHQFTLASPECGMVQERMSNHLIRFRQAHPALAHRN